VRPDASGGRWQAGGDDTCHFLAVIAGRVEFDGRWQLPALGPGACAILPAAAGRQELACGVEDGRPPRLLRVCLP
jgi:hypothetical protein